MQKMQEIQVQSVGQEDPLEKEMATHSSTLAWSISWTEEPDGVTDSDMTEQLSTDLLYGCSCLHFRDEEMGLEHWNTLNMASQTLRLRGGFALVLKFMFSSFATLPQVF